MYYEIENLNEEFFIDIQGEKLSSSIAVEFYNLEQFAKSKSVTGDT